MENGIEVGIKTDGSAVGTVEEMYRDQVNEKNNPFKPEVVWQSPETTPNGKPFMQVKKARGYYYYAERGGRDSIAFILYDQKSGLVGLISESKPPLDEVFKEKHMRITAFGGSIDMDGKTPDEICQIEVFEEAGYKVDMERILCVGTTMVSTQMNQGCIGYIVDVTDLEPGMTEADLMNEEQQLKDPDEFNHNKVVWCNDDDVMHNNDWKSIWIFSKAYHSALKDVMGQAKEDTENSVNLTGAKND